MPEFVSIGGDWRPKIKQQPAVQPIEEQKAAQNDVKQTSDESAESKPKARRRKRTAKRK